MSEDGKGYQTEIDPLIEKEDEESVTDDGEAGTIKHRKTRSVDFTLAPRFGGLHRRHGTSLSALGNSLRNLRAHLEPIREDVTESVRLVQQSFVGELDKFDRGESGFLDMSMTQSLSVIPDDIPSLGEETGLVQQEEIPAGPPVIQYLSLLAAVVAVSSNSTALHLLVGVKAPMKLFWRMTASYLALSIFAFRSVMNHGFPILSFGTWLTFLAAAMCYSIHSVLFIQSLDYTTIGNALIFTNSQALLLILGKAFVGERIHVLEGLGVLIAFSGAILCSKDSEGSSSPQTDDTHRSYIGDCLALASAVAGVGYLTFAKSVRSHMPVTFFLFSVMVVGSFMVLMFIVVNPNLTIQFNFDPYNGILGWWNISEERLPIVLYLAVVVNLVGTLGFVRGKKHSAFFWGKKGEWVVGFCLLACLFLPSMMEHVSIW